MTQMRHGSYSAKIEFDHDIGRFHGEVVNIRSVITFQARSADELRQAFVDSIADYLEFCMQRGETPELPLSAS